MTPCIPYDGHIRRNGYGWRTLRKKAMNAHRAAWIEAVGEIASGLDVCHRCDNRACVNLEHLFLGTRAENLRDMREKGRHSPPPIIRGERNNNVTITDEEVALIRGPLRCVPTRILAKHFDVTRETINNILSGRTRVAVSIDS